MCSRLPLTKPWNTGNNLIFWDNLQEHLSKTPKVVNNCAVFNLKNGWKINADGINMQGNLISVLWDIERLPDVREQ